MDSSISPQFFVHTLAYSQDAMLNRSPATFFLKTNASFSFPMSVSEAFPGAVLQIVIGAGIRSEMIKNVQYFVKVFKKLLTQHNDNSSLTLGKTTTQCKCATGHIISFCGFITFN